VAGSAIAQNGSALAIAADTICVHGDRPDAAEFAQRLRAGLVAAGIRIAAVSQVPA
jgi:5-oxoprolinase (ATP-hydrolysing) subunit A